MELVINAEKYLFYLFDRKLWIRYGYGVTYKMP
jgi:hypothetical protein